MTETVYTVEEDEDENEHVRVSVSFGYTLQNIGTNQNLLQTVKKQSEMLFVRGDSVVLIAPNAPS